MAKSKYPIEAKTFGEKIRKSRMDKGWTLLKVADMVGISESYLARIEADKQTPEPGVAMKIADVLHEDKIDYFQESILQKIIKSSYKEYEPTIEELFKSKQFSQIIKLGKNKKKIVNVDPALSFNEYLNQKDKSK